MTTRLDVSPDAEALAARVAECLVTRLGDLQEAGRTPHVVLTGGSISAVIYAHVASLARDAGVDWTNVVFWWGDERFVASDSPDRNAGQARAALLNVVGVPEGNIHEMASVCAAADVDAGAAAYAEELAELVPGDFDLVLLGMGPDGHVASLFPGFAQLGAEAFVVGVTGSPKPPPERITLTFPRLNQTHSLWLVVSGAEKAPAVSAALAGAASQALSPLPGDPVPGGPLPVLPPASRVQGRVETVWFLDQPASRR